MRNKKPYEAFRKDHMVTHLQRKHGMTGPLSCETCSRSGRVLMFSSSGCLQQHFLHKHNQYGLPQPNSQELIVTDQASPTHGMSSLSITTRCWLMQAFGISSQFSTIPPHCYKPWHRSSGFTIPKSHYLPSQSFGQVIFLEYIRHGE